MTYTPQTTKDRTLHRLKIAHGHLRKVIHMVENDTYCVDIINQSQAVQKALEKVDSIILENHLKGCLSNAIKQGNQDSAIAEVMTVFKKTR